MPARKAKAPVSGQLTAFQHLTEQLKWVDLVIEVADARLPESSRHPQADRLFAGKPRLVVFAKEDLADRERTGAFLKREASQPQRQALALALKTGRGRERLLAAALRLTEDRRERLAAKGLLPRPVRACVVGLPNVGKSSLINWLIGRKKAPVGDRPGVTRGAHWVRLHPAIELLDTPGILPPTSFEPGTATKLAFLNLVPEASYDAEEIARLGADLLCRLYPQCLQSYGISLDPAEDPLAQIAKARRWLTAGGNPDVRRAGQVFLHDVRAGAIGRLTLD